jgi:SWI/SNF-related matrix-associated actin-dependent regulator of chromatin subfamily A3
MGLGKTLQTIGAILANPPEGQTGYPYRPRGRGSPPRCTLILAPLSVMANWTMQIRKHVNQRGRKEVLKVASYHGPNRHQMVPMIENNCYDIVLTSYHTLAYDYRIYAEQKDGKECKKKAKVTQEKRLFLFDLLLHRIILDEAHIIRNSKTGLFKAVKQLSAKYKLCLTGVRDTVVIYGPWCLNSLGLTFVTSVYRLRL